MCLVISTGTKLDKSHSSITWMAVFLSWSFAVLISFRTILCYSFQGQPHLSWSETLTVLWNFERISEMLPFEIPSSLALFVGSSSLVYVKSPKTFARPFLGVVSYLPLSFKTATTNFNDWEWKWFQQRQCFFLKKKNTKNPLISGQLVEIYISLKRPKTFTQPFIYIYIYIYII